MGAMALDIATVTGWAVYTKGMNRPAWGHMRFSTKADEMGPQGRKLYDFLTEKHRLYGFDELCFEAQHVPHPGKDRQSAGMNPDTLKRLFGLGMVAEMWCFDHKVDCYDCEIATWRKHFLGRGSGFKQAGLDPKKMALEKAERLGWLCDIADEAEACGILSYYLHLDPNFVAPWRDNDFMGANLR